MPDASPWPRLARAALLAFVIQAASFVFLGGLAQSVDLPFGIWFTQLAIFLLPPVLLARAFNLRPGRYLGFATLPASHVMGLVIVASIGNYLFASGAMGLLDHTLPESWHLVDVERVLEMESGWRLALVLTGVTVLAPLGEEATFRGYLLRPLTARYGPWVGIGATALLFSALHADPIGFLPRLELGLFFGWLVWRTGSVWPAILAHALNNGTAAALFLFTDAETRRAAEAATLPEQLPGLLGAMGLGVLILLPMLVSIARRTSPPKEALPRLDARAEVRLRPDSPEAALLGLLALTTTAVALFWIFGMAFSAAGSA